MQEGSKFGFSVLSPPRQHCSSLNNIRGGYGARAGLGKAGCIYESVNIYTYLDTAGTGAVGLHAGNVFRYGRLTFAALPCIHATANDSAAVLDVFMRFAYI